MISITTTVLQTNIGIDPNELEAAKKALASWLKLKGFAQHGFIHNHENEDDPEYVKQPYPLIQLRCPNGFLQLWGMQQGAQVLQQVMMGEMLRGFQYKGTQFRIIPEETFIKQEEVGFATGDEQYFYELNYFIAFSPPNFKSWQQLPTAAERMQRLQELLLNNITMFCKTAGLLVQKDLIKLNIYWVWHTRWVLIKDYKVLAFTLSYTCNIKMPDGIALGRQTKLGYGWQTVRTARAEEPPLSEN